VSDVSEPSSENVDVGVTGALGDAIVSTLRESYPHLDFSRFQPIVGPGQDVVVVGPEDLIDFAMAAKDAGFAMFVDLCGVDYFRRDPRFDVVVTVLSLEPPARLRIRVPVSGADPSVPSLTAVYAGANFYEREAYDLFGIDFPGHPDLSRILLPDEWEGHPLRKDYGVGSVPVRFKKAHKAQ
jgi:NADH-quinone oxidoreductase subunit C